MPPEEKEEAIAFFTEHPFSELVQDERAAGDFDETTRLYYAMFRWLILLSAISIASGVAVFALCGICVLLSRRSQQAQYLSLLVGWQLLRLYGAFQVVAQGVMVLALSYWVTALWFQRFSVKLIALAGLAAGAGALAVIVAIFKKPRLDLVVEGKLLDPAGSPRLWKDLDAICEKVGTARPDNVIAGIDDNFYVTEAPVIVEGTVCRGRTLFVSLALLKQLSGEEADAILAHEMAHFSGDDTVYSRKLAPLLARFGQYLQALGENPLSRPIYYFMAAFRALFELSLGEHSRSREFRADRIAAEVTSPRSFAGGMLRAVAYSDFRGRVQGELYVQDRALETVGISARLEREFHDHAKSFAANPGLGDLVAAHPFDSHPPMARRLEAVGVPLGSQDVASLVATPGDGRWYRAIDGAEAMERSQWEEFEERFRAAHEVSLPYRFLPETDEEHAIVVRSFPEITIEGKKGTLRLDCETIHYSAWPGELAFSEVVGMSIHEHTLNIAYEREGAGNESIPTKTFGARQAEVLQGIQTYYGRYATAAAYQRQKRQESGAEATE
jgi:Zn-dependent protease with chaperone function